MFRQSRLPISMELVLTYLKLKSWVTIGNKFSIQRHPRRTKRQHTPRLVEFGPYLKLSRDLKETPYIKVQVLEIIRKRRGIWKMPVPSRFHIKLAVVGWRNILATVLRALF